MPWAKWHMLCRPKDKGGLGFRNLTCFNKALLAKQVWKLISKPNSFLAQVLKAKYYKDGSVLTATVRSNASFAWRSICWSRSLVIQGSRWKVGSGNNIRVFHDQFVQEFPNGLPQPCTAINSQLRVSELMTEDGDWDEGRLNDVCWPVVAYAISRTPILEEGNDRCLWKHEERGQYSVKTGYLAEIGYYNTPDSASGAGRSDWNSLVWQADIPPKMRIFLCRAFMDFIPTQLNLHLHHVPVKGNCERCNKEWGSTAHEIIFCKYVKELWTPTVFWPIIQKMRGCSMMEIGRAIQHRCSKHEFNLWAVLLSSIWTHLCKLKHEPDEPRYELGFDAAKTFLDLYQSARQSLKVDGALCLRPGKKIWYPPDDNVYRLDIDASVNEKLGKFGVGAVVRDSVGAVRAALACPTAQPNSVLDAELVAVLYGIGVCLQERLGPVVVYSDSLLAVRLLSGAGGNETYLQEELPMLADLVSNNMIIHFRHMYREANMVAHTLARFGAGCDELIT